MNRKLKEVRQELGRGGYEADEDAAALKRWYFMIKKL